MILRLLCPSGHVLDVDAQLAGRKIRCGACGKIMVVPIPANRAAKKPVATPPTSPPVKPPAKPQPPPPKPSTKPNAKLQAVRLPKPQTPPMVADPLPATPP